MGPEMGPQWWPRTAQGARIRRGRCSDTEDGAGGVPREARGPVRSCLGAGELCMHPRTLQRRLKFEGRKFESIKDEVRREAALRYLQQPNVPFTEIASRLGYSEQSVLIRSCDRWFSASPR